MSDSSLRPVNTDHFLVEMTALATAEQMLHREQQMLRLAQQLKSVVELCSSEDALVVERSRNSASPPLRRPQ